MSDWITAIGRISFPRLLESEADDNGVEKFSTAIVFEPGTDLTAGKKLVLEAGVEEWGDDFAKLVKAGKIRLPFRTDGEDKGYPEGSVFFSARSTRKPGLWSAIPDPKNEGRPTRISDDQAEERDGPFSIYPGVMGRLSVDVFTYNKKGNMGVSFALNNFLRVSDGERFDGMTSGGDEFSADPSLVADLSDIDGVDGDDVPAVTKEVARKKAKKPAAAAASGNSLDDLMGDL